MDAIVEAALKKWPNVPHCHGWLALDARGDWYMRDERTQAVGPFPHIKGSKITHEKLREFIHRNYLHDEQGGWFFQNGPQRVYVELEAAPHVWRLQAADLGPPSIHSHTGAQAEFHRAWLDEHDRLFLTCICRGEAVLGLVHSLDMAIAAEAVEQAHWLPEPCTHATLLTQHHCQLRPAQE